MERTRRLLIFLILMINIVVVPLPVNVASIDQTDHHSLHHLGMNLQLSFNPRSASILCFFSLVLVRSSPSSLLCWHLSSISSISCLYLYSIWISDSTCINKNCIDSENVFDCDDMIDIYLGVRIWTLLNGTGDWFDALF